MFHGGSINTSKNSDQLTAVKAVLKALKIPYEPQEEFSFPPVTKSDIDEAYAEARNGKSTVVDVKNLWK